MRIYAAILLTIGIAVCIGHVTGTLVHISGGISKVILGWSIPVDLPMPMSINYAHNFQFQYNDISNSSQLSYLGQGARSVHVIQKRAIVTRPLVYAILEDAMRRAGFDKHCLLRAICETAASPFDHSGLIGELLQVILTPQTDYTVNDYSVAWRTGLEGGDCLQQYDLCPYGHSALDHLANYI